MKLEDVKKLTQVRCEKCGSDQNIETVYFLDNSQEVVIYCTPCQNATVDILRAMGSSYET